MNHTKTFLTDKPSGNYTPLTAEEIRALRKEGEYFAHLSHIPHHQRDRAIYAVGQYAFGVLGFGYGFEQERLDYLRTWMLDRKVFRSNSETERQIEALARAVNWKPPAVKQAKRGLSERVIDRMVATRKTLGCFLQANINRMNKARAKIYQAYLWLRHCGMDISRNAIRRVCGCDTKTISKYKDMWSADLNDNEQGGGSGITPDGDDQPLEIRSPLALLDLEEKKKNQTTEVALRPSGRDSLLDIDSIRFWYQKKLAARKLSHAQLSSAPKAQSAPVFAKHLQDGCSEAPSCQGNRQAAEDRKRTGSGGKRNECARYSNAHVGGKIADVATKSIRGGGG